MHTGGRTTGHLHVKFDPWSGGRQQGHLLRARGAIDRESPGRNKQEWENTGGRAEILVDSEAHLTSGWHFKARGLERGRAQSVQAMLKDNPNSCRQFVVEERKNLQ